MSNFFPGSGTGQAQALYVPGCSNGAATCSGNTLNAMDPRTGQVVLPPAGRNNTQVLIGTPIPERQSAQRHPQAGDGISETATPGRRSSSVRASARPTT